MGAIEFAGQGFEVALARERVGVAIGGAHAALDDGGHALGQMTTDIADLVLFTAGDDRVVEDRVDRSASALAPSRTKRVGLVTSSPRSRRPTKRRLTTVAFSVSPSTNARGCLVPSMSIPRATTHRCWAKWTPSTMMATRSRPDRSTAISSARADSVAATKRRDTADLDTERVLALIVSPMGSSPI